MKDFSKDPPTVIDRYSNDFERAFLDLVRKSYRLGQFSANVVYNEYINSRNHVQMSMTKWATLSEFVKYLGRAGKSEVEETAKGWLIVYSNRETEMERKRIRIDSVEENQELDMKRPIQEAAPEQTIEMEFPEMVSEGDESSDSYGKSCGNLAVDGLMREQEKVKDQSNRKDCWLYKYTGEIEMMETKHVLKVSQKELETVIPYIGALVKIVNGAYRGHNARLLAVDTNKYCAKVQIEHGSSHGKILPAVDYDDICKFCSS
ncbi:DNA/RNA-binding protein KIN17 [Heracleum sosnowskyi]|uniref:DNA/RNA-binding protein KIN17 n=1 Tax=Heracleum sosnowskyi TaxID=360622 RepID=A0AAD8ME43_9APIA|nr:DNA/RNA-binding protein KIN17 [Heracleum sosnowskyi]